MSCLENVANCHHVFMVKALEQRNRDRKLPPEEEVKFEDNIGELESEIVAGRRTYEISFREGVRATLPLIRQVLCVYVVSWCGGYYIRLCFWCPRGCGFGVAVGSCSSVFWEHAWVAPVELPQESTTTVMTRVSLSPSCLVEKLRTPSPVA
jgi:hypothetical protein